MIEQLDMFAAPPAVAAPAASIPFTDDDLALQAPLKAVANGHDVGWQILRDLVGAGYVHATTKRLVITEEGRALLAALARNEGAE